MRKIIVYTFDLVMVAVATFAAFALRNNLDLTWPDIAAFAPHLLVTVLAAAAVIPAFGVHAQMWRFTSMSGYLRVAAAAGAIVLLAVAVGFVANRLESVSRSVPILQVILISVCLTGVRVLVRLRHQARVKPAMLATPVTGQGRESILIVGVNRLTEVYLQALPELAGDRFVVAGLLGSRDRQVGRVVASVPVLGMPEQVESVLADLEVHGIAISRIVVTTAFDKLSDEARVALLAIERATTIRLDVLAERLGLEDTNGNPDRSGQGRDHRDHRDRPLADRPVPARNDDGTTFSFSPADLASIGRRPYWRIKRAIDAVGALVLIAALLPVMLLVAVAVVAALGLPAVFWQQRPGLGGLPFRMYKFRTLATAHAADGRRRTEAERISTVGMFLRRTRLDELPQLFNILGGEMSFVGPRPLLPHDQPPDSATRLLVRPGLTGWAQVIGGRTISAIDKAALDAWYVRHASLRLDAEIALRTIDTVVRGERVSTAAIRQAWSDLASAGLLAKPGEAKAAEAARGDTEATPPEPCEPEPRDRHHTVIIESRWSRRTDGDDDTAAALPADARDTAGRQPQPQPVAGPRTRRGRAPADKLLH